MFDGQKSEPYLESDAPNPLSAYGRTKLYGEAAAGEQAWVVRSSGLFGPTGTNFVHTMLDLARTREEVAVVDDQRTSPTYVGHLATATRDLVRSRGAREPTTAIRIAPATGGQKASSTLPVASTSIPAESGPTKASR